MSKITPLIKTAAKVFLVGLVIGFVYNLVTNR